MSSCFADDVVFLADVHALAGSHKASANVGLQDGNDGNVTLWPQLASKTDRGISADSDTRQHERLAPRGPRQLTSVADVADAAGRAARSATANAGVWNVETQAGFEDAQTLWHAHLPVRIGHGKGTVPTFAKHARTACREHQYERSTIGDRKVKQRYSIDDGTLRWRDRINMLGAPLRLGGELNDFLRSMMCTNHCKWRKQHSNRA